MIDGRWTKIHPLTELLFVKVNEDFTYQGTVVKIESDILELNTLTNFSFGAQDEKLFFFNGFKFPDYREDNLYKFLPPQTSRDKLPSFGRSLYKIDLHEGVWRIEKCEGPEGCGAYGGSIAMLNSKEMILTGDPHMFLFSERILEPPKCELSEVFGSCSMSLTVKNRESYRCSTPRCRKSIHLKCDKSIRGKKNQPKLCPLCNDLDPETWKKKKTIQLSNRN